METLSKTVFVLISFTSVSPTVQLYSFVSSDCSMPANLFFSATLYGENFDNNIKTHKIVKVVLTRDALNE